MTDHHAAIWRVMHPWCLLSVLGLALAACSVDSIVGSPKLPAGITDPASMNTARGALEAYRGARVLFTAAFSEYLAKSALFSDEEEYGSTLGDQVTPGGSPLDQRILPEGVSEYETAGVYTNLAKVRGQAQQALGLLSAYAPDSLALRIG